MNPQTPPVAPARPIINQAFNSHERHHLKDLAEFKKLYHSTKFCLVAYIIQLVYALATFVYVFSSFDSSMAFAGLCFWLLQLIAVIVLEGNNLSIMNQIYNESIGKHLKRLHLQKTIIFLLNIISFLAVTVMVKVGLQAAEELNYSNDVWQAVHTAFYYVMMILGPIAVSLIGIINFAGTAKDRKRLLALIYPGAHKGHFIHLSSSIIATLIIAAVIGFNAIRIIHLDCDQDCLHFDEFGVCDSPCRPSSLIDRWHNEYNPKRWITGPRNVVLMTSNDMYLNDRIVYENDNLKAGEYQKDVADLPFSNTTKQRVTKLVKQLINDNLHTENTGSYKEIENNDNTIFIDFDNLDYHDKRLLASVIERNEATIDFYQINYQYDGLYYTLTEQNDKVTARYSAQSYSENFTPIQLTAYDQQELRSYVHRLCAKKNQYEVTVDNQSTLDSVEIKSAEYLKGLINKSGE